MTAQQLPSLVGEGELLRRYNIVFNKEYAKYLIKTLHYPLINMYYISLLNKIVKYNKEEIENYIKIKIFAFNKE